MTCEIEIEKNFTTRTDREGRKFDIKEVADKIHETVMDHLKCPYETSVNLLLTDNDSIHEINKNMRDIDRETDVLSFPCFDYSSPADFSDVENDAGIWEPETGELLLGDIVISTEKAEEQAANFGHSVLREYAFLMVHSLLHLTGFDHIEEEDRLIMEEKQREIMELLNISR